VFPGVAGSVGFGGAAADPQTGLVYVNTSSEGSVLVANATAVENADGAPRARVPFRGAARAPADPLAIVVPPPRRAGTVDVAAGAAGAGGMAGPDSAELGWPCQRPPWGELVAVDSVRGTIAWRVPLGITEQLPPGRERSGRPNAGGPIVTAGGVVVVAATDDRRFRACDARNGEELWSTELPVAAHAVPMTYRGTSGRQFIAIVAAGPVASDAGRPQVVAAYALD
jgi:quinoprotein glucose dehydrogenase